jgi:hypothetical protein
MWKYNHMLWRLWEYWHNKPHTPDTPECENHLMTGTDRYPPTSPLFSEKYIAQWEVLFNKAQKLANDNKIIKDRVDLAKFSLLYLRLCRDIGYYDPLPDQPQWMTVNLNPEPKSKYVEMLEEFEKIAKDNGIQALDNKGGQGVSRIINKWREILNQ